MKKTLLFIAAITLALTTSAQGLQRAPQGRSARLQSTASAPQKATIAPADGQFWWGYYNGTDELGGLGTGQAETFDMAIYIPQGHSFVSGNPIHAMRIYIADKSVLKDVKIWFSTSLPSNVDAAEVCQKVDASDLTNGPNDIALTTPYTQTKGFYAGYTYTLTDPDGYPILVGGNYVKNGLFLRSSKVVTIWGAQTDFGNLALQLLVENKSLPETAAAPQDFGPVGVALGETVDVPIEVLNMGSASIDELSYTVTVDGSTTAEKAVTLSAPISFNNSGLFLASVPAAATLGKHSTTITITKVNGKANASETPSAQGIVQTVAELKTWPRTVLIEEFTTEYCGYCPQAAQTLQQMFTTYPKLKTQAAVVCHHAGYYTDWLTVNADKEYTWFYNSNSTYAPAFMYDRYAFDSVTPVNGQPSSASGFKNYIDARLEASSRANIELQAYFNEDKTKVTVSTACEQAFDFSDTPTRITIFLTEDNIAARSQAGTSGTFTHQHVLRAVNATWGKELSWNDDKASYEYTFTLGSTWKTADLKVVAFISGYDSSDPTNCVIENAAFTTISDEPVVGIEAMRENELSDNQNIYGLDGRRISSSKASLQTLPKGVYVVGGRKIVVR